MARARANKTEKSMETNLDTAVLGLKLSEARQLASGVAGRRAAVDGRGWKSSCIVSRAGGLRERERRPESCEMLSEASASSASLTGEEMGRNMDSCAFIRSRSFSRA